jgi:hypothetical protein
MGVACRHAGLDTTHRTSLLALEAQQLNAVVGYY